MAATEQDRRHYNDDDATMIADGRTMRETFILDKNDFTNENNVIFGNPFDNNWNLALQAAEDVPTDEQVNDQLTQLTAAVEVQMDLGRKTFQKMKVSIQEAFPNNTNKWNEFGFDDYGSVSQSQVQFINFFERLWKTANDVVNSAPLILKGYTQLKIDGLKTIHDNLNAANIAQEKFIKLIPAITAERIAKGNTAYGFSQKVSEMGKIIYANTYAKYIRYLLSPANSPEDFSILGTITRTVTNQVLSGALITLEGTNYSATSRLNGSYGIPIVPDGTYTVRVELQNYQTAEIPNVVVVAGTPVSLNIQLTAL